MTETKDLGNYLYNEDIWPSPMKKPETKFLGIDAILISPDQIPFDEKLLDNKLSPVIENEYGEKLVYGVDGYTLYTNDPTRYLENWFCKWQMAPYMDLEVLKEKYDEISKTGKLKEWYPDLTGIWEEDVENFKLNFSKVVRSEHYTACDIVDRYKELIGQEVLKKAASDYLDKAITNEEFERGFKEFVVFGETYYVVPSEKPEEEERKCPYEHMELCWVMSDILEWQLRYATGIALATGEPTFYELQTYTDKGAKHVIYARHKSAKGVVLLDNP